MKLFNLPKAGISVPDDYEDLLRWWASTYRRESYISDPRCPISMVFCEYCMYQINQLGIEKLISSPYEEKN